jgi:hypothetical protein
VTDPPKQSGKEHKGGRLGSPEGIPSLDNDPSAGSPTERNFVKDSSVLITSLFS